MRQYMESARENSCVKKSEKAQISSVDLWVQGESDQLTNDEEQKRVH